MVPLRTERRGERAVGCVVLAAVFLSHAAILMRYPVVGTAENGDFWRVTKPAGIISLDRRTGISEVDYGIQPTFLYQEIGFSNVAMNPYRWSLP